MVIRRRSGVSCLNTPLRIWLLAGISSALLAIVVVCLFTRPVQAHVLVPQPAASVPSSVPVFVRTTPESLSTGRTIAAQRKALLRGKASWYGEAFDGRTTASGERFDMFGLTACHPTLPFGSLVRVVNLKNGRSVTVRITDRGDLPEGRIIDLSFAAAEKLAMTNKGLAPVVLDVLSRGTR
jgi:rare lipoprotein A